MAKTVLITLTTAGADTGPFDLYSDADGYATPFESGISKAALVAGYTSIVVPDAATIIRVKSVNANCPNYIDLTIVTSTTTTTTSTTTTHTTTTTTTSTTTTLGPAVFSGSFVIHNGSGVNSIVVSDVSTSALFTGSTIGPGGAHSYTVAGSIPNGGHMVIRVTCASTMTITSNGIVATNTTKGTTGNGTNFIQITFTPTSFPNTCVVSNETDFTTP